MGDEASASLLRVQALFFKLPHFHPETLYDAAAPLNREGLPLLGWLGSANN